MPDFIYHTTLSTQLLLPGLFSGVLLLGFIFSLYIYTKTSKKIYFASALFLFASFAFASFESLIILIGGVHYNREVSVQLHRLQQLSIASMLFVIPYLMSVTSPGTHKSLDLKIAKAGGVLFLTIVVLAFSYPDSFVSITSFPPRSLLKEADFGRGKEGVLYILRDIAILLAFLYSMASITISILQKKVNRMTNWLFLGITCCFILAIFDIVNVYTDFKLRLPPVLDFSYGVIGVSCFGIFIMVGSFSVFIHQLIDREHSLKRIQRLANVGGVEWPRHSNTVTLSDEFIRTFNLPQQRYIAPRYFIDNHLPRSERRNFKELMKRTLENRPAPPFVSRILSEQGEIRWAHFTAPEVLEFKNGKPQRLIWSVQDITDRKEMEEHLSHIQKMEAVGQLAGGIAHDFNNNLSIICNAADIMKFEMESNTPAEEYLKIIQESTEQARSLTRELLNFSRKEKREYEILQVHNTLSTSVDLLRHSISKEVLIVDTFRADRDTLSGNANQLQNCFLNIGINAGHAMPKGGTLTISTLNCSFDEHYCHCSPFPLKKGQYISIKIEDTGTGIEKENLRKIFDPFFTTKGKGVGTGLGLSSVHGIVKHHGGEILVESAIGKGTTFIINLPLQQP